jgi:hypothetical protein
MDDGHGMGIRTGTNAACGLRLVQRTVGSSSVFFFSLSKVSPCWRHSVGNERISVGVCMYVRGVNKSPT